MADIGRNYAEFALTFSNIERVTTIAVEVSELAAAPQARGLRVFVRLGSRIGTSQARKLLKDGAAGELESLS